MSDERMTAAEDLRKWRIKHQDLFAGNEARCDLLLEQALRDDVVPDGSLRARPENYPIDADND